MSINTTVPVPITEFLPVLTPFHTIDKHTYPEIILGISFNGKEYEPIEYLGEKELLKIQKSDILVNVQSI